MPVNWSKQEIEAIVEDYLDMLRRELRGESYNKSAHRRALQTRLDGRSDGSIEFKHQNISAVLHEIGAPAIDGYRPRFHYQEALFDMVVNVWSRRHDLHELIREQVSGEVAIPTVENILDAMVAAPAAEEKASSKEVAEGRSPYIERSVNFLDLEAKNSALGDAGEAFVINFERARLIYSGRGNLADRVEQVSVTKGPTAGFDVLSFETSGEERFIEAKTTRYGKNTPFFVTANELGVSQSNPDRYYLYRVFQFEKSPRLFTLRGDIGERCVLSPTQYRGVAR